MKDVALEEKLICPACHEEILEGPAILFATPDGPEYAHVEDCWTVSDEVLWIEYNKDIPCERVQIKYLKE